MRTPGDHPDPPTRQGHLPHEGQQGTGPAVCKPQKPEWPLQKPGRVHRHLEAVSLLPVQCPWHWERCPQDADAGLGVQRRGCPYRSRDRGRGMAEMSCLAAKGQLRRQLLFGHCEDRRAAISELSTWSTRPHLRLLPGPQASFPHTRGTGGASLCSAFVWILPASLRAHRNTACLPL